MKCAICGGVVIWKKDLQSTKCQSCGSGNTQLSEDEDPEGIAEMDFSAHPKDCDCIECE